ncbi:MAG TPA: hypothetical protein VFU69_07790 [Ktedonobacterales bacterium]|nr:hypothetical protein [Ktedonobacterales bacterium]
MPDWAVMALALGIWPLLLVLAIYLVIRGTATSWNTDREAANLPASAHEHAQDLLRDVLEQREYEQLMQRGYLDISSPSNPQRIYRIRRNGGLVSVYEQGKAIQEVCVQSTELLPRDDVVVLHKLMIQGNEQEYLAKANQFPPLFPRQRYSP